MHHQPRYQVSVLRHWGRAIGTALARVDEHTWDSRETLPTKEQQLAVLGVSWETNLAYEADLAEELAAARRRRLMGPF